MGDDFRIEGAPGDTVTSLSWSPKTDHLISTSWAFDIRCWEVGRSGAKAKSKKDAKAPVFCSSWSEDGKNVFFGSADGKAFMWGLGSDQVKQIGVHEGPVAAIKPLPSRSSPIIATLGWDQTVKYWDLRSSRPTATLKLPNRCFVMDVSRRCLVVGGAKQHDSQEVYFVRLDGNPDRITKTYTSALKRYMRAIAIFPDEKGWACTGIEGRTAVEHFNPPRDARERDSPFAFKCHRKGDKENQVFPVHGLACHPKVQGAFASCGGDGTVAYWDRKGKTRLQHYFKGNDIPVTALAFNSGGSFLAYARGYDWAKGARDRGTVTVHLKRVSDRDVTPQTGGGGFR